jgi:polar amino acid transport system permease protein
MRFDTGLILASLPSVAQAFVITLSIWLASVIGSAALGFVVALARRYGPAPVQWVLRLYTEVMRGTPFLIQLFLLYYGGPYLGLSLDPVPAGLLGLTVYGAAYYGEVFRGGFLAVPHGHVEAAECLGLTRAQIVWRILLPEMAILVLPPAVNLAIVLVKETAVLSIITVPELTLVISGIGSQYYAFVEALFLLAVCYWGLVEVCNWLGRVGEARLSRLKFHAS